MGRKKTEFTKEQDARITQLLNDGYSLSGILSVVNKEFNSNFSRSGIDRRIKSLGIIRGEIDDKAKRVVTKSDIVKYIINKHYYNAANTWEEYRVRTHFTLDAYAKRIGVSKPTLLKYLKTYNLPSPITPDMKKFFDISSVDLRMYKEGTINAIITKLRNKTDVVIETNVTIKVGNTDVTVEMFFPEYNTVLLCGNYDEHYNKKREELEIPSKLIYKWYDKIRDEANYKVLYYGLVYNCFRRRITQYNTQYVCDSIIKDLGLPLKEL